MKSVGSTEPDVPKVLRSTFVKDLASHGRRVRSAAVVISTLAALMMILTAASSCVGHAASGGVSSSVPTVSVKEPPGLVASRTSPIAVSPTSPKSPVEASGVTLDYYNLVGYEGNNAIYPTEYGTTVFLPQTQTNRVYQTSSNDSNIVPNGIVLAASGQMPGHQLEQSYYNYNSQTGIFQLEITFSSASGSQQFEGAAYCCGDCTQYPEYCTDFYYVPYVGLSEQTVGIPSGSYVQYLTAAQTGVNLTSGNQQGGTYQIPDVVNLALDLGALFIPENLGTLWDLASLDKDIVSFGSYSDSSHPYQTSVPNADGTMVQWGQTTGGSWGFLSGGSNSVDQSSTIEIQIDSAHLPLVTPGFVNISAQNQLGLETTSSGGSFINTFSGASATLVYPVAQASSIGGHAYLYYNSGCSSSCPLLTGFNAIAEQTGGHATLDYYETTDQNGFWHFFMPPYQYNPNTYCRYGPWWNYTATYSNALGSTTVRTPVPCSAQMSGADTENLDLNMNAGQVTGKVMGYAGGSGSPVSGATAQLCNSNGCISATSDSTGTYVLDFPVAGTSTNPYTLTVSCPSCSGSWVAHSYAGLQLPVGQTTQKNLWLTPGYSVTFQETGLSSGTQWSVTMPTGGGTLSASAPSSVVFNNEPNATYSYTVGAVNGYTSTPSSSTVTVNGKAVSVTISFTKASTYQVTFKESGLPTGITWWAYLNGVAGDATTPSSIVFSASDGTWSFSVPEADVHCIGRLGCSYYQPSPSSGTITVSNGPVSKTISFTLPGSVPALSHPATSALVPSSGTHLAITEWSAVAVPRPALEIMD